MEPADWFDEMEVFTAAVATLVLGRELGEAEGEVFRLCQRVSALVALETGSTAGTRCKEIVAVHGTNLVCVSIPRSGAVGAGDLMRAHQAPDTDSSQVGRAVILGLDQQGRTVELERGEKKSAIYEWKLVVHHHSTATQHTADETGLVVCQATEDKGPRVITGPVTIVLHLDVVGVDQVTRDELLEHLVVAAMGERLHKGGDSGQDARRRGHSDSVLAGHGIAV